MSVHRPLQCWCVFIVLLIAGCSSNQTPKPISVSITPQTAAILTTQTAQFDATLMNDASGVTWSATGGTVDPNGVFSPAAGSAGATASVTATSVKDPTKSATATVNVVASGQVVATTHPLVANYTISAPSAASVSVEFGTDTNYGLTTSSTTVPQGGGSAAILVAGMKASTLYHMRAVMQFDDGSQVADADQTFTTAAIPPNIIQTVTATTTPGATPQPGVEMVNTVFPGIGAAAYDLSGNPVWYYNFKTPGSSFVQPIHLMSNGHFLVVVSPSSGLPLSPNTPPAGTISVVREVDLVGNTIKEISIDDLNTKMTAAGFNITLAVFHHDALALPNGHWMVLANTLKAFTDLPGHPGVTNVLGDVLVDLDASLNPVWVWNQFDVLDVNRQPMQFPDWTHSNAVIYSADDKNLIVSIRHQHWLVKIDYEDGKGDGHILWKLGHQGDFTLMNGTDPTDWFYAQHGPAFASANSTGQFLLSIFDNGDGRVYPTACSGTSCNYSTAKILQIDEQAKTATIQTSVTAPPQYSFWGGNAEVLKNGNLEFNASAVPPGNTTSDVFERTAESSSQTVWQLHIPVSAYRSFRMPSLYPGVQW